MQENLEQPLSTFGRFFNLWITDIFLVIIKKDGSIVFEFIFLVFFNPPCMFSASCISCCYTVQALSEDMGHFSLSADEQKAPSFVHTHFLKAPQLS